MAFKSAPRLDGLVPIADWQAKEAMASHAAVPGGLREKHEEALERAKDVEDDVSEALGAKDVPARYKIQVFFTGKRTTQGPNDVTLTFWESANELHGGGDELMYICRDGSSKENPPPGCGTIFSGSNISGSNAGLIATCPGCKRIVNANRLARDLTGRKTSRELAKALAGLWYKLGGNAALYLKFQPGDIRYVAASGDGVSSYRRGQIPVMYPLKRILEDTSVGSNLESRFYAFLTA